MAVEVPKEAKVYTTVYDNFKGVDYTDDASNVFKRRSPDGLNMLPDLDGKPYKRTGWEISVPSDEFVPVGGSTDVATDRLHHFTLGGTEYIMIFNTYGVFYMTKGTGVVRCRLYQEGASEEDYPLFPPPIYGDNSDGGKTVLTADANRAFYFEGNGVAGFYTFVGNSLFRFDGSYYHEVEPYVPTVYNGASPSNPTGVKLAENINLLTPMRTVSYMGDGTKDYSLPSNAEILEEIVDVYADSEQTQYGSSWLYRPFSTEHGVCPCSVCIDAGGIQPDGDVCPYVLSGGEGHMTPREIQDFEILEMRYTEEELAQMTQDEKNAITPWYKMLDVTPEEGIAYRLCANSSGHEKGEMFAWNGSAYVPYVAKYDITVKVYDEETAEFVGKEMGVDYEVTHDGGVVEFETAAIPAVSTFDNVRITYIPAEEGTTYSVKAKTSKTITLTSTVKEQRSRTKTIKKTTQKKTSSGGSFVEAEQTSISAWNTTKTLPDLVEVWPVIEEANTSETIQLPNNASISRTVILDDLSDDAETSETEWSTSAQEYVGRVWNANGSSVTLTGTSKAAKDYGTASTTDTGWANKKVTTKKTSTKTITTTTYTQTQTRTYTKTFNIKVEYFEQSVIGSTTGEQSAEIAKGKTAFTSCRKVLNYGNNIYNQVFMSSATVPGYKTRAWYCAKNDPSYFPDLNYIEVGSDDTEIVGMSKVGNYVGFMKAGTGTDSSVYFAYPTVFNDIETFAVRQGVNGIGAVSPWAFNILNGEPLFLSKEGVVGIEVSDEETDRKAYNRSWFINKKLLAEKVDLKSAVSYVYEGMYYLAINNHCYVLDGSQKNSWMNEKTNLQYECYYLENVPATWFADMDGDLYFSDRKGNICRFKKDSEEKAYRDAYYAEGKLIDYNSIEIPIDEQTGLKDLEAMKAYIGTQVLVTGDDTIDVTETVDIEALEAVDYTLNKQPLVGTQITVSFAVVSGTGRETLQLKPVFTAGTPGQFPPQITSPWITYDGGSGFHVREAGESGAHCLLKTINYEIEAEPIEAGVYSIVGVDEDNRTFNMEKGVPIPARWATIADDDGAVHFFKNLQKKGTVISLMPAVNSGVDVYLKADEKDRMLVGRSDAGAHELPFEHYVKKKVKKYKRLQIICENNELDDSFGVDQIIKSYTMGNYSKNRK